MSLGTCAGPFGFLFLSQCPPLTISFVVNFLLLLIVVVIIIIVIIVVAFPEKVHQE